MSYIKDLLECNKDCWGDVQWDGVAKQIVFDAVKVFANFLKLIFLKKNTISANGGSSDSDDTMPQQSLRGNSIMNWKSITAIVIIVLVIALVPFTIGINDAGYRTVVQYPNGTLNIKFTPGVYTKWFGETTTYKDVITFDFDKKANKDGGTLDENGIAVRYQDGGTGTIFGLVRFRLPSTDQEMLKIHKDFRSNKGIAYKLLKNTTEEIMNNTAGLMTSEESYAEKRSTFTQMAKDQLGSGKYVTKLKEVVAVEDGMEFCLNIDGSVNRKDEKCKSVKTTVKQVPEIAYGADGHPQKLSSDLKEYNISITGFNVIDWGYEQKTLDQIAAKRQATMAIITAKANAEKAKQDAVTAEQQGLANVMEAKYQKEVEKQRAIVDADKEKEVAIIAAKQKVGVAEQEKLEAVQKKLAAAEEKQRQILLGEGEAKRKQLVMAADGQLGLRLDAYKEVNFHYADAISAYKGNWVPGVMMGASANGANSMNGAQQLIELLSVKTAKDLSLDMTDLSGNAQQLTK